MYVFSKTIGLRDPEETSANGVQSCFPVLHPLWGDSKAENACGTISIFSSYCQICSYTVIS